MVPHVTITPMTATADQMPAEEEVCGQPPSPPPPLSLMMFNYINDKSATRVEKRGPETKLAIGMRAGECVV